MHFENSRVYEYVKIFDVRHEKIDRKVFVSVIPKLPTFQHLTLLTKSRCHAKRRYGMIWYDNDKDLMVGFLVTHISCLESLNY